MATGKPALVIEWGSVSEKYRSYFSMDAKEPWKN